VRRYLAVAAAVNIQVICALYGFPAYCYCTI
jgi:hypothetical protein